MKLATRIVKLTVPHSGAWPNSSGAILRNEPPVARVPVLLIIFWGHKSATVNSSSRLPLPSTTTSRVACLAN